MQAAFRAEGAYCPGGCRACLARPASPWIKAAAFAVPLCVLPSAAWRLGLVAQFVVNGGDRCAVSDPVGAAYLVSLSFVSIGLAWLTVGLVSRWGEVFPRWLPILGERRVNAKAAMLAAATGATMLAMAQVYFAVMHIWFADTLPPVPAGCHRPEWEVLRWYTPLTLWPPLLYLVTYDYWKRHRSADPDPDDLAVAPAPN